MQSRDWLERAAVVERSFAVRRIGRKYVLSPRDAQRLCHLLFSDGKTSSRIDNPQMQVADRLIDCGFSSGLPSRHLTPLGSSRGDASIIL